MISIEDNVSYDPPVVMNTPKPASKRKIELIEQLLYPTPIENQRLQQINTPNKSKMSRHKSVGRSG